MLPKFVIMIALFMSIAAAISGIIMLITHKDDQVGRPIAYIGVIGCVTYGVLYRCISDSEDEDSEDLESQS